MESQKGERLLTMGRAGEAERIFRALLERLERGAAYDSRYDQTLILRNIGLCQRAQGQPTAAARFYRQALTQAEALLAEWRSTEHAPFDNAQGKPRNTDNEKTLQRQIGIYHTDLADVLTDLGQYAAARQEYETSLAIKREIGGEERGIGVVLGQLGTLALVQNDLAEARRRHQEALQTFQRMGEDRMEAVAWHQLGRVAETAAERAGAGAQGPAPQPAAALWQEAERCYQQSLAIKEQIGDLALAATTCNQLAIVAEGAGRPQDAERWYLKAIEIGEKLGDEQALAKRYSNLADLLMAQNRLAEAETYARRAAAIMETLDLSAEPWKTYNILAQIAERGGRMDEARQWRRRAQETRLAFESGSDADTSSPNVRQMADQWNDVAAGVAAVCQSGKADPALDKFLTEMAAKDDWRKLVAALRQVMAGKRAMDLFDGLDDVDSAVLRRVLKALGEGKGRRSTTAGKSETEGGLTIPQLLDLVEQAAGGNQALGGQLFNAFQGMAGDPNAPPEIKALADVLLHVLIGERSPDLSRLPAELASAVRGLLGRLRNG
jgi:tetratricopeptide (TPR) repeat protein